MNINFGIIIPLGYRVKGKRNKNQEISRRSLEMIDALKQEVCPIELSSIGAVQSSRPPC